MKYRKVGSALAILLAIWIAFSPSGCVAARSVISFITRQPNVEIKFRSPLRRHCKKIYAELKDRQPPSIRAFQSIQNLVKREMPLGTSRKQVMQSLNRHIRRLEANTSGPYAFGHYRVRLMCSAPTAALLDMDRVCLVLVLGFESDKLTEAHLSMDGFKGSEQSLPLSKRVPNKSE